MGNANLLDVASAVLARPARGEFYARQLASSTGLSDPVVHPCLRRLEAAGALLVVESAGREHLYQRSDHPFWRFVKELDKLTDE